MAKFLAEHGHPSDGVDEYLARFFPDDYKGVMIDVGAYHPTYLSSSFYFYNQGWKVISIEPNPYAADWLRAERSDVLEYAVSDENTDENMLALCNDGIQPFNPGWAAAWSTLTPFIVKRARNKIHSEVPVKTRTLTFLLDEYYPSIDKIDVLAIDVEGMENLVLAGFDFERWLPSIIVVEVWKVNLIDNLPSQYSLKAEIRENKFYHREQ